MVFFKLALRNILRRGTRNILVMIGIGIGIASFVMLSSISSKMLEKVESSDPIKEQIRISTRGGIDYNGVKYLEHLSKVKTVSPVVLKGVSIEVKGEPRSVVLRMVDPKKEMKLKSWELTSGRWLLPEDTNAVVIGSKLADIIEKNIGDTLDIEERKYRIVGIVEANSLSLSSNIDSAIIMPLTMDTKFSEVLIQAESINDVDNIVKSIKKNIPGVDILAGKELLTEKVLWSLRLMPLAISGAALLVSFFMIITTLLTSVFERTREIGIIKSIGATNSHVVKIFMFESVIIGFLSSIIGILLVYGFNILFFIIWKWFVNPELEFTFFEIPHRVAISGILLGTGVSLVAGVYPAFKAARLNIVEALRT